MSNKTSAGRQNDHWSELAAPPKESTPTLFFFLNEVKSCPHSTKKPMHKKTEIAIDQVGGQCYKILPANLVNLDLADAGFHGLIVRKNSRHFGECRESKKLI